MMYEQVDIGNVFFTTGFYENRYIVLTGKVVNVTGDRLQVHRYDGFRPHDWREYRVADIGRTIFRTKTEAEAYCRSRQEINDKWANITRLRGWQAET